MSHQLLALDPQSYSRHRLHAQERDWAETNCYTDLWIELLHAMGYEPMAALPFTLTIDFEGDQWSFFKFPISDLLELYSLEVQEHMVWRPLPGHIEEQLMLGRPVLVELDSFYLPDTAGSAYQLEHVKTTVAINEIDVQNQRLGYFHAQGYYHLTGEDFLKVFHLDGSRNPAILPPYCEIVKRRPAPALQGNDLLTASQRLLAVHLQRLPEVNPFEKFRTRFEADLKWLVDEPITTFHQYSFATLRQFGACYEIAAFYLEWLQSNGVTELEEPITSIRWLSSSAKTMQFQLARAMARKKPIDLSTIDQMAEHWTKAMSALKTKFPA